MLWKGAQSYVSVTPGYESRTRKHWTHHFIKKCRNEIKCFPGLFVFSKMKNHDIPKSKAFQVASCLSLHSEDHQWSAGHLKQRSCSTTPVRVANDRVYYSYTAKQMAISAFIQRQETVFGLCFDVLLVVITWMGNMDNAMPNFTVTKSADNGSVRKAKASND